MELAALIRSQYENEEGLEDPHVLVQNYPAYTKQPLKTDVWVSVSLCLEKILLVEQQFRVTGWLNFYWLDPLLPSKQSVEPGFSIMDDGENIPINLNALFDNASEYEIVGEPAYRYNENTSAVSLSIRFKALLLEILELEKFPFDRQFLTIRICVRTKEFRILRRPPDFVPNRLSHRTMASFTVAPSVTGYSFLSPLVDHCKGQGMSEDTRLTVSLRVERMPLYWLYNVVLPVFLFVLLLPITFAISPSDIGGRMGIILAILLTLVTFKFIVQAEIPKINTVRSHPFIVLRTVRGPSCERSRIQHRAHRARRAAPIAPRAPPARARDDGAHHPFGVRKRWPVPSRRGTRESAARRPGRAGRCTDSGNCRRASWSRPRSRRRAGALGGAATWGVREPQPRAPIPQAFPAAVWSGRAWPRGGIRGPGAA